ncbi:MAG: hypothetical protein U0N52_03530 [Muribaculaceae bacterium]|jgi:lipoprotein|nr:hypothetical protein [Prevotella sp.]
MFSATKILTATAISFVLFASCGQSDTGEAEARKLLTEAQAALENGDAKLSLSLLDSLDSRFAKYVSVRRDGINLRARAQERYFQRELEMADSLAAVLAVRVDSIKNTRLRWVNEPMEGYYIAEGSELPPTGVEGRLTPEGEFFMVSSLQGHPISHTAISLTDGAGKSARSADVAYDGEANRRSGGNERIYFAGEGIDTIGHFAFENRRGPLTLTFEGNTVYTRPLTTGELENLATVYEYAWSLRQMKVAGLRHESLERKLDIARQQVARTTPDKSASPDN